MEAITQVKITSAEKIENVAEHVAVSIDENTVVVVPEIEEAESANFLLWFRQPKIASFISKFTVLLFSRSEDGVGGGFVI